MRPKTLVTSVVLSLVVVALIGYLVVGCSSLKEVALRRAQDHSVANAEVAEEKAKTDPQAEATVEPAYSLEQTVVSRASKSHAGEELVVAGKPDTATDSVVVRNLESETSSADATIRRRLRGKNDDDVRLSLSDRAPRATPVPPASTVLSTGPVTKRLQERQDSPGVLGGDIKVDHSDVLYYEYGEEVDYGWDGAARPRSSADSRSGYAGPIREYAPAGPQTPSSTMRPNRFKSYGVSGGSRRGGRSSGWTTSITTVPVELMNVSADEVWVIAKPEVQAVPAADDEDPDCGAMLAKLPGKEEKVPLPLKHTDVKGQISGYIATVNVTQQFHNPYDEKIEAVYVFPLPQNAAINEFIMTIGERRIRGIIREREQAEQIYRQARSQGYVASLLTQERPNVFTQKVANIEPSKQIDVNIKYFNTLAYVDGWYEFVFPMVVGPRFNPPGSTDGVGAVARGKPGISGQKTEVQYLKPGERSGHDISLTVDIDAGVAIEQVTCASHVISNHSETRDKRTIKLSKLDSIPNKDFVLRYKVAGKKVKSALVTHRDERGGFFTMMLYPPENLSYLKRAPMEMIFVLDCSGSMSGKPIAKAKQAITRALKKLQPDDTFQVIRFSNNASQLGPDPLPATPANVRKGLKYVESLQGSGGTMMIEGIRAALGFAHDPHRFRLVSFMTDGYIGNEAEILAEVHNSLGASRVFSFGVGSSVNRYLLDRMAKIGKGAVAYIGLDDRAGEVVDQFYERISHPALADVTIDWGDMQVTDVYPSRIPDLFVGRPVIVTGRFKGARNTTVGVAGRVGDLSQEINIPVNLEDSATSHPGIACVWARKRIETLGNLAVYDSNPDLPDEIKQVALEYGLMSSYTAFIAVDSSRKTDGDHGITVAVPVPVPDGVRYDTTVQN